MSVLCERPLTRTALFAVTVACLLGLLVTPAAAGTELTPEALAALGRLFPDASVVELDREVEAGVHYIEVVLRDGDREFEVEVTPNGEIGEVEAVVSMEQLPQATRAQVMHLTASASERRVERHEIHGVPQDGKLVRLDPPQVIYEVSYRQDGRWHEFTVADNGDPLAKGDPGFEYDDDADDEEDEEDEDEDGV